MADADRESFDIFRQVIAFSTADSWSRIPHVSYVYEADAVRLLDFHRGLSGRFSDGEGRPLKITLNTLFMKILAEGLVAAPDLNAHFKYSRLSSRGRLTRRPHVDMTLPWLLPEGKVVSVVVPRVEEASLAELQISINDLGRRIEASDIRELLNRTSLDDTRKQLRSGHRAGFARLVSVALNLNSLHFLKGEDKRKYYGKPTAERLSARDVDSGSVVVSNIGSLQKGLRGEFALLDVIAPMVFAVGVSAIQDKPAVVIDTAGAKSLAVRPILPLCFAFDHRAFEFATLLPFLDRLEELFARPESLEAGL